MDAPGTQNNVENVIRVRANYGKWKFFRAPSALRFATPLTLGITCNAWAFSSRALLLLCVLLERTTVDDNDIVTAVLSNPDAQDALRVIARIAIREVALRANSSPPVEDVTVIGDVTIDRLRHTVSVDGAIRSTKPREFALLETLARRQGIVFSRGRLLDLAWPDPEGVDDERTVDVHIRRLRAKLGAANIRTVPGVGYALKQAVFKRLCA